MHIPHASTYDNNKKIKNKIKKSNTYSDAMFSMENVLTVQIH